ncbi:hypothetical protein M3Y97_00406700 [Aphelenchoides bicaudatus]|nr:hypothetical protein M3Y97_00406700 [Aphelenchoides bicaudatus]
MLQSTPTTQQIATPWQLIFQDKKSFCWTLANNFQLERISDKKSSEARDKERQIQKLRQSISDLKQQINKKTNNISSPASNSDKNKPNKNGQPVNVGALPPVFLEKQLLAVHISLQHEISDEKKKVLLNIVFTDNDRIKVVQLLTKLRSIQNELPAEQLESFDQLPVQPSPTPSISNMNEISEEDAKQLEAKQSQLLAEVTYYRDLAARLRSRLEQCTVLLANTERQAMHKDLGSTADDADPNNALLVTRF